MTTKDPALERARQSLVDTRKELQLLRGPDGIVTGAGIQAWEQEYQTSFPGMGYYRVMETQERVLLRDWDLE